MLGLARNSSAKGRASFGAILSAVPLVSGLAFAEEASAFRLIVDGVPMLVERDMSFMKFTPVASLDPKTGVTSEIEPFPTPALWVVVRNDGTPTSNADRALARQAMQYVCEQSGRDYLLKPRFATSPAGRPVWIMGQEGGECRQ